MAFLKSGHIINYSDSRPEQTPQKETSVPIDSIYNQLTTRNGCVSVPPN